MRRGTLHLVVALALAAALAGPVAPARAAGSNGRGGPIWSWAGLWSWLAAAVTHQPALQADCDRGSQIDPNGRCVAVVTPVADCGSHMDPDGGCRAAVAPLADCGPYIDPNGSCHTR